MSFKKNLMIVLGMILIASMILSACGPAAPEVVEKIVKEEVVVTATPEPEPEAEDEGITDFADVPADVLVKVCEAVKASATYDDDAMTLTLNMPGAFAPMLQTLANGWAAPLDQAWVAAQGGWDGSCDNWVDWHDPSAEESVLFDVANGTGPYMLEHWKKGQEMSFVANPNYYRTEPIWEGGPSGPPAIGRYVIKSVDEWGTRFSMFEAGDTDMTYVPRQYAEQVDALVGVECDYATEECETVGTGQLKLYGKLPNVSSTDGFFNFMINAEGGNPYIGSGTLGNGIPPDFFADIHIRKAFNYCMDWDTFIEDAFLGEAEQRLGPIINPMLGYHADDFAYTYDLEKAAEEFKLADIDKDGIPAGEDEEGDVWTEGFFMVTNYNTGNDQRRVMAEIVKAGVESVNPNFQMEILSVPWPTYLKAMIAGNLGMFWIGWLEDYHHPHNWVGPYMATSGTWSSFQHFPEEWYAEFDAKMAEALSYSDPVKADAAYHELQLLAVERVIDIFGVQSTGRSYQPLYLEGWYYNAAYPATPYAYALSKTDEAKDPDTFIFTTIGEPETFDPAYMYDTASSGALMQMYDPLIFMDREDYSNFVPAVAESWEISEDGATITFKIREGVKFHNGDELKAHDAAYAIWRGMLQDRSGGPQWMFWEPLMADYSVESYAISLANEMAE